MEMIEEFSSNGRGFVAGVAKHFSKKGKKGDITYAVTKYMNGYAVHKVPFDKNDVPIAVLGKGKNEILPYIEADMLYFNGRETAKHFMECYLLYTSKIQKFIYHDRN